MYAPLSRLPPVPSSGVRPVQYKCVYGVVGGLGVATRGQERDAVVVELWCACRRVDSSGDKTVVRHCVGRRSVRSTRP